MEITLRRAHALEKACAEVIGTLNVEPSFQLTVYTNDLDKVLFEKDADAKRIINNISDLLSAQYIIRQLIGQKNSISIGPLLTQKALLNEREKVISGLLGIRAISVNKRYNISNSYIEHDFLKISPIVNGIKERMKIATSEIQEQIEVATLSPETVKNFENALSNIKRDRRNIQDEIAELNLTTKITLPDDVVKTLHKHNII
jgi:hypothetical protein